LNLDVEMGNALFNRPKQPTEWALDEAQKRDARPQLLNRLRDYETVCARCRCDVALHCIVDVDVAFTPSPFLLFLSGGGAFFSGGVVAQKA
jgi:hypothetical protein